ncbi:Glutamine cyclotransferase [Gracilaria domingensis]|nr:Glutamine cyclotransferase [Gracilaria domingensis]
MMASTATYEITDTDELEALGRDDPMYDTSAGLGEDAVPDQPYYHPSQPRWKNRWCLPLVLLVLAFAAISAFVGIFVSLRQGKQQPDSNNASQDLPVSAPDSADSSQNLTSAPIADEDAAVRTFAVNITKKLPHDSMAFTQGFEHGNGAFYESTGLPGRSSLRKVDIETGKVLQVHDFSEMTLFGEGMTLHTSHHIFMLTWKAGRGFIFNQSTLEVQKEWTYDGEGWGLTMDRENDEVYMSDGTSQLRVLDPEDLSEKRRVNVTLNGEPADQLNELEWVCGEVWSNVWTTSLIYRIDPNTGKVNSVINAGILPLKADITQGQQVNVLNGIAFDKESGRLWLTGKLWPVIYQVTITDPSLDLTKCD